MSVSFSIPEVKCLSRVFDALSCATGDDLKQAFALQKQFEKCWCLSQRGDVTSAGQALLASAQLSNDLRSSCFWDPSWV